MADYEEKSEETHSLFPVVFHRGSYVISLFFSLSCVNMGVTKTLRPGKNSTNLS